MLIATGATDGPWRSFTMAGTPSLFGPSLFKLAKLTVHESDAKGARFGRFVERSDFGNGSVKEAGAPAERYEDTPACERPEFSAPGGAKTAVSEAA